MITNAFVIGYTASALYSVALAHSIYTSMAGSSWGTFWKGHCPPPSSQVNYLEPNYIKLNWDKIANDFQKTKKS
jgi:hypothetical protein